MFAFHSRRGVPAVLVTTAVIAAGVVAARAPAQPQIIITPQTQPTQPSQPVPQQAPDATSVLTETVGLLGGLQLYQTYLNVGLLADAQAEGLYEASELAQLLGSVITPLEQVDRQLEKVAALKGLSKDDVVALTRMRKIVGLLRQQGKSLQAFWDTGVEDHATKYEATRKTVWKELDELLELEPRTTAAPEPKPVEKTRP